MASCIRSIAENGMEGIGVEIECHLSNGLPSMVIVGYASKSVDEAKERVRNAFAANSLNFPKKRITVNLAPGDLPKEGTGLDLAIAVAVLAASGQIEATKLDNTAFLGELGLDGSVRPIRGIIGKLIAARGLGITTCYVPCSNTQQASLVPGIQLIPVESLRQLYLHLTKVETIPKYTRKAQVEPVLFAALNQVDMAEVIGQPNAKRALEIAAAGGHNVLLTGPPGTGKSMLAKAFRSILPVMSRQEILEVTHLHSLASNNYDALITERPFRAPHHSASHISVTGGGQKPRPGEISLAHKGVLFLDELPEFSRQTIESLRQPLEDHRITVARAKGSIDFPAHFTLIATANPCPCGYYGTSKTCDCLPSQIAKYQRKLSGPLMDRIDMHVDVSEVDHKSLLSTTSQGDSSNTVRERVEKARKTQADRYNNGSKINGEMTNRDIRKTALLSPEAVELLNKAGEQLQISARNYMRAIKVARTIADLDGQPQIKLAHIAEALQYRQRAANFVMVDA